MRGKSSSEDWLGVSSQSTHRQRRLDVQVATLIERIAAVVPLRSVPWQEPLRMVLTHPRPLSELQDFHARMRALCRRTRFDEQFADLLESAAHAIVLSHKMGNFIAPIRLVIMAAVGAMSARPSASMVAARQLIEDGGLERPLPLSFATSPEPWTTFEVLKADATTTLGTVVQRAVSTLLQEQVLGRNEFASWDEREILAGMEALWLAYTYCQFGTARAGKLSADELRLDWERCGAPLWLRLDDACHRAHSISSSKPYSDKSADAGRLALAIGSMVALKVQSTVPISFSSAVACSSANSLTHVVCRSTIPSSSEKQDKEEIERHRILETPLHVALMPSLQFIEKSKATLLTEFPWATAVVEVVFDDLQGRANLGVRELTLPPTLLVGLPGAGKSRLARRFAEILDLPRLDISLAGTSDTKILGGTSRGWSTGRPSDLASLLARRHTASALVLLDEVDKAHDSHREGGGISAYLLSLLEPETASRHYDSFLKTECDFSKVSWLCTANTLSRISQSLRSRLRILVVPQPKTQHFSVVSSGVIAELEQRWRLPAGTLPSVEDLRIDWEDLRSARQVRAATEATIGQWARTVIRH